MGQYRAAQICLQGHKITSDVETSRELTANFCPRCGSPTTTQCEHCKTRIKGYYYVEGVISIRDTSAPRFCYACGKPFPWTEAKLKAAEELADEIDELTGEDKHILKRSIVDLTTDGPRTELASVRYRKLVTKAGKVVGGALNSIVVSVATDAAKKLLGL